MPRAVVYLHRAPSLSHATPLLHVLRRAKRWAVAVARSEWDREAGTGLPPAYDERLQRLGVPVVSHPRRFRPDVLFTFDPVEGEFDGCGLTVRLPASVIGKGIRYGAGRSPELDNLADFVLVPGPWHRRRMEESGRMFVPLRRAGLAAGENGR